MRAQRCDCRRGGFGTYLAAQFVGNLSGAEIGIRGSYDALQARDEAVRNPRALHLADKYKDAELQIFGS